MGKGRDEERGKGENGVKAWKWGISPWLLEDRRPWRNECPGDSQTKFIPDICCEEDELFMDIVGRLLTDSAVKFCKKNHATLTVNFTYFLSHPVPIISSSSSALLQFFNLFVTREVWLPLHASVRISFKSLCRCSNLSLFKTLFCANPN